MMKIDYDQSVSFSTYEYSNNICPRITIKNEFFAQITSTSIVVSKSIHNIAIQYSIYSSAYDIKKQTTYYDISIELFFTSGKPIRRIRLTLKDGLSISKIGLDFYINDYYITITNNRFSIYKNNDPIFSNIDAYHE